MRRPKNDPFICEKNYDVAEEHPLQLVACLNGIFKKVNQQGFTCETLDELNGEIDVIASNFDIDARSVVLLAAILERTNTNSCMDEEDLAMYLGCSNIEFISSHGSLQELQKKGIIQVNTGGRRYFRVTAEALKAIENDAKFIPPKTTGLTAEELFFRFGTLFNSFRQDNIDEDRLIEELDSLVRNNDHLPFCRQALGSALYGPCNETERRMFYYMCHSYVSQGEDTVAIDILLHFIDSFMMNPMRVRSGLAAGGSDLQRAKLVEFAIDDGMADTDSLALPDEVKSAFFEGVEIVKNPGKKQEDLVSASSIREKRLFFNEAESVQMERLAGLLNEENYQGIRSRLAEAGMRKGFNILFYGAPGTGKTASAFELARQTGRDIFVVDMSKLRSKWVGESEKSVKALFGIYRRLCRKSEKAPILLFNEADAIFAKRFESVEHSVDQMSNTLQNIILQEMENLDGILIATTNLVGNFDAAFERRFLFKVQFRKPEAPTRAKIWKSMIADLSDADAETLARRFSFSGGNIENVVRKSSVEYVLTGNRPTVETLATFCEEETYAKAAPQRKKIGF